MQSNHWGLHFVHLKVVAILIIASPASVAYAIEPATRETIQSLSPEETTALLRRKERFDALPVGEQERLRQLNESIASSENGDQLLGTLDRYHEWLKSLSTKQRTDLLELPVDQRIERIKELMEDQERDRLRKMAEKPLPETDIDAIFNWLDDFMKQHEDEFLNRLHSDYADKLRKQDEVSRRRSLMRSIIMRGPRSEYPLPMREDFERLLPQLTPATRADFESAKTPEQKQQFARRWIFSAMISRVLPPASDEDLHKILSTMPADQRERLERKSPEEVKRELTWLHHWQNWPGREGYRGGPGFFGGQGGPGGFRPGGTGGSSGGGGRGSGGPPPKRSEGPRPMSEPPPPSGTNDSEKPGKS